MKLTFKKMMLIVLMTIIPVTFCAPGHQTKPVEKVASPSITLTWLTMDSFHFTKRTSL